MFITIKKINSVSASGLGDLRNNHEPTVTYEGDNNILLQQTSNWFLRQAKELRNTSKEELVFPLTCVQYLCQPEICQQYKFTGSNIDDICSHACRLESFNLFRPLSL